MYRHRLRPPPRPLATRGVAGVAGTTQALVTKALGSGTVAARGRHTLTVNGWQIQSTAADPPVITSQPVGQNVTAPASATFTVTATGSAPLSYQWQRNGVNIGGATSSSYTLTPTSTGDSGAAFRCIVTNAFGSATSSAASLTVASGNNVPAWGSAANATFTLAQGASLDLRGSPYFTDADGNPMTMALVSGALPAGVTFNNGVFTASAGATLGTAGPFTVSADDGVTETVTTFTLTSTSTQTAAPFMLGHGFKKGDVPNGIGLYVSEPNAHVVVKRRWNDNSVKHAIIVGRTDLTANVAKTLTIYKNGSRGGTALTSANIQSAAPAASVQCGAIGTVNLSSLLASPFRTWISTPEMVECHYRSAVGADTNLVAWFQVRLWAGGRVWVRAIVENGYLDNVAGTAANSNSNKSYFPTVTVGGVTVYNNGGASLTHQANTRWMAEGWIGTNPSVTPSHNAAYLRSTKLVPNYWKNSPPAANLNAYDGNYTPMAAGDIPALMSDGGFSPHIGLLPAWQAHYCQTGDARAWRAVMKNSSAINSRAIVWRSRSTNGIPRPSSYATWTIYGPGGGGEKELTRNGLQWEYHHSVHESYLAYLISGDYWHYESMGMQASLKYLFLSSNRGSGANRIISHDEIRGNAWAHRTVGAYVGIAPTGDADADSYRNWLQVGGFQHWQSKGPNGAGGNQLGYPVGLSTYDPNLPLTQAPWQMHFWIQSQGFIWDIETGQADTTAQQAIRDFMYKGVVGILGGTGTDNFCWTQANTYNITISPLVKPNFDYTEPADFYSTWGQVWQATFGAPNNACGTALGGTLSNEIARGYWANLLPAIAYAVDHGATGAAASWARMTGATNWSTFENGSHWTGDTWHSMPIWGIVPRS